MSSHIYLLKESNDLVSHCSCERALITFPAQADCPWCGCGWLFSCIDCRKAFTFASGVEVEEPWEDLARRDLTKLCDENPDDDEVDEWVEAMQEMLAYVKPGQRYVCLDGSYIAADAAGIELEGWYARHHLDFVPQVAALSDPSVIKSILSNYAYWKSHALGLDS